MLELNERVYLLCMLVLKLLLILFRCLPARPSGIKTERSIKLIGSATNLRWLGSRSIFYFYLAQSIFSSLLNSLVTPKLGFISLTATIKLRES